MIINKIQSLLKLKTWLKIAKKNKNEMRIVLSYLEMQVEEQKLYLQRKDAEIRGLEREIKELEEE